MGNKNTNFMECDSSGIATTLPTNGSVKEHAENKTDVTDSSSTDPVNDQNGGNTATTEEQGQPQQQQQQQPQQQRPETKNMMDASIRSFTVPAQPNSKVNSSDFVQVTDALSDVCVKYHVNSKELGHGHYGIVRKCMNRETNQWYAIKSIQRPR